MQWEEEGFTYSPHPLRQVIYGPGRLAVLPSVMERLVATRAVVITSPSLVSTGLAQAVVDAAGGFVTAVFGKVRPHSPIEVVEQAVDDTLSAGADCVISLGGGSSVDTAKGVVHFHRERTGARLRHVAIPSTLSGAEYSAGAGITHGALKRIYRSDLYCEVVLLDPVVAAETPVDVFLPSGLNAIAHCVEGICSVAGNAVSEAIMLQAIRVLAGALPALKQDSADLAARGRAQVGAALAGIGSAGIPVGLEHALAHAVGGMYKAPHAVVHAILITPVMRFNKAAVLEAQSAIGSALGKESDGATHEEVAERAIAAIDDLLGLLGIPSRLRALGVRGEDLEQLARSAWDDPCFPTNPRRVTSIQEVVGVLQDAL